MLSAWRRQHDLADDACPECQGSCYVPASIQKERMVNACPQCEGNGKNSTKKAA